MQAPSDGLLIIVNYKVTGMSYTHPHCKTTGLVLKAASFLVRPNNHNLRPVPIFKSSIHRNPTVLDKVRVHAAPYCRRIPKVTLPLLLALAGERGFYFRVAVTFRWL